MWLFIFDNVGVAVALLNQPDVASHRHAHVDDFGDAVALLNQPDVDE
jgi:hypothetical protein